MDAEWMDAKYKMDAIHYIKIRMDVNNHICKEVHKRSQQALAVVGGDTGLKKLGLSKDWLSSNKGLLRLC